MKNPLPYLIKNRYYILYFLLTSIAVVAVAFYNNFPLVYSDSGTYMVNSVHLEPAFDRPIGYGLFLRIFGMRTSLWVPIFVQGLLVNLVIWRIVTHFFEGKYRFLVHSGSIGFLVLLSSMSWYASQVMPDFFSGLIGLGMFLFLLERKLGWLLYLFVLLFFISITHFSSVMVTCLSLGVLGYYLWIRKKEQLIALRIKARSLVVGGIMVLGVLFLCFYNWGAHNQFKPSLSSNIFLMARVCETGILKDYLNETCNDSPCSLCEFKDNLPPAAVQFIWWDGPFTKRTKTWPEMNDEYGIILKDIFSHPEYVMRFGTNAIESTFRQLLNVDIGNGMGKYGVNSPPYYPIRDEYKTELNGFLTSRQNGTEYDFNFLNQLNYVVLILSTLLVFWTWISGLLDVKWKLLVLLVFLNMFFNAMVTGALANVYARLQARTTWPLVLIALLITFKMLQPFISQKANQLKRSWKENGLSSNN